jgi:hypothetical protein
MIVRTTLGSPHLCDRQVGAASCLPRLPQCCRGECETPMLRSCLRTQTNRDHFPISTRDGESFSGLTKLNKKQRHMNKLSLNQFARKPDPAVACPLCAVVAVSTRSVTEIKHTTPTSLPSRPLCGWHNGPSCSVPLLRRGFVGRHCQENSWNRCVKVQSRPEGPCRHQRPAR